MAASSLHQHQNGQIVGPTAVPGVGSGSTTTDNNDFETKLQLVVKNVGDSSQGITALINRQLQGISWLHPSPCIVTTFYIYYPAAHFQRRLTVE